MANNDGSPKVVPEGYWCSKCGISGVKLWRESDTFCISLKCARCLGVKIENISNDGRVNTDFGMSNHFCNHVPAVPQRGIKRSYYWYSTIPIVEMQWWCSLPNFL